jgi:hypothetical protein
MRVILFLCFLSIIFLNNFSLASMQSVHKISQLDQISTHLENMDKDVIIFVDIDDTIIIPKSSTFAAPPFNKIIDNIKENEEFYPDYAEIISSWRQQRQIMLLDKEWPKFIEMLKKKFKVFALTSLSVSQFGKITSMEKWRHQELTNLGINFSQLDLEDVKFKNGASYYKGIFFTGDNTKSKTIDIFKTYLSSNTYMLIDDRSKHIDDLYKYCQDKNLSYVGLHYTGPTKHSKPDPRIHAIQLNYLINKYIWLEDQQALEKINQLK